MLRIAILLTAFLFSFLGIYYMTRDDTPTNWMPCNAPDNNGILVCYIIGGSTIPCSMPNQNGGRTCRFTTNESKATTEHECVTDYSQCTGGARFYIESGHSCTGTLTCREIR